MNDITDDKRFNDIAALFFANPVRPPEPKNREAVLHFAGDRPPQKRRWRVNKHIPLVGTGNFIGARYIGKSVLGCRLSYDLWHSPRLFGADIVKRCSTLWVGAESPEQIEAMLQAMPVAYGSWPFTWVQNEDGKPLPRLLTPKGYIDESAVAFYVETAHKTQREQLERFPADEPELGFMVFDTMIRVSGFGATGENDTAACANVWDALGRIGRESNTFVLGFDHMGWNRERARGGSSKEDNPDVVAYIEQAEGGVGLWFEKIKGATAAIHYGFKVVPRPINTDDGEDDDTAGWVEWDYHVKASSGRNKGKAQPGPKALKRLRQACARTTTAKFPLPETELRQAHQAYCKTLELGDSAEREAWRSLLVNEHIVIKDGMVFLKAEELEVDVTPPFDLCQLRHPRQDCVSRQGPKAPLTFLTRKPVKIVIC